MESTRITVKAPNQKVEDQKYSINLASNVKELKFYLQLHYPGNPKTTEQKLIYMGKLLDDSTELRDILKQDMHDRDGSHTFHLVCCCSNKNIETNLTGSNDSAEGVSVTRKPTEEDVESSAEVLAPLVTWAVEQPQAFNMSWSLAATSSVPTMMPGMPYTPEQMIWLQQIYAQQMANYMHLVQHGYQYEHGENVPASGEPLNDAAVDLPAGVAAAGGGAARLPQNNQQMVMNAAGGQAVFEDEDEDLNRDWLDWSYIMCRFAVLLAIVYFYSTLGRFFMVFGFFFVIYLYQNGWFRVHRRLPRQENQPQQVEDTPADDNNGENTEEANTQPVQGPGILKVVVSFFLTFFTSLIPQQPVPVNAN